MRNNGRGMQQHGLNGCTSCMTVNQILTGLQQRLSEEIHVGGSQPLVQGLWLEIFLHGAVNSR